MSFYIRTIPSRFVALSNVRKQVTQTERRLPKQLRSTFLCKFFDTRVTICSATTITGKTKRYTDIYSLNQDPSPVYSNTFSRNAALKRYNTEKRQSIYSDRQKLTNCEMYNNFQLTVRDFIIESNKTSADITLWNKKYIMDYAFKEMYRKPLTIQNSRTSDVNFDSKKIDHNLSKQMLCLTDGISSSRKHNKPVEEKHTGKPTQEQLQEIYECLRRDLPKLFVQTMDYKIYNKDIIFINNIRGRITKGLFNYMKQVIFLRAVAHLKFAYIAMDILKMTVHPEDGTIKVRWRIVGITGIRVIFTFWKFNIWKLKETLQEQESWYDGFSVFYVGSDGKIYKHIADKMMPNQNIELDEKEKAPIATKLALFLGIKEPETYTLNQYFAKEGITNKEARV